MKSKLVILAIFLHAQAFAAGDNVSVKFRAIAPGLAPLSASFSSAGKEDFVEIPEGVRSQARKYSGPSQALFRDVAGRRMFPVTFPDSSRLLLVILRIGPDGEPSAIVIEDDEEAAPAGSLCFVNIGGIPLRVNAGEETADIEPGGKCVLPAGKSTVFVRVLRPDTGDVLMSNNWALAPGARTLAILDPGAAGGAGLRVHRFSDAKQQK